jgi:ATP-dependent DNA helicase RecQ
VRQKSGFDVGLNHLVAVLTGSEAEGVLRWQHHTLSTFGIGKELGRNEWGAIGRELVRLGLLRQASGMMPTVSLTDEGMATLKERRTVRLTKPREAPKASVPRAVAASGAVTCDEVLFEKLRRLRKRLADEQGVPPYIVFGDVSLRHMARDYPTTERDFLTIPGVGETKLRVYGDEFLAEIESHVAANGRARF